MGEVEVLVVVVPVTVFTVGVILTGDVVLGLVTVVAVLVGEVELVFWVVEEPGVTVLRAVVGVGTVVLAPVGVRAVDDAVAVAAALGTNRGSTQ